MPPPIRLVVSGCCGRMGSLIIEEALKDSQHFNLVGALEHEGHPEIGKPVAGSPSLKVQSDLNGLLKTADLLIDFTTPEASLLHASSAAHAKVPVLIGTTGFTSGQLEQLRDISKKIPIFWSPNMSTGIFIVRRTIQSIFEILKGLGLVEVTKVAISETHHAKKKDAPSGTAKQLAADVRKASGQPFEDTEIESKREGDVVGLHSITFQSGSQQITLQHEAASRRVFAEGALLVARYFSMETRNKTGWYEMDNFFDFMLKATPKK